MWALPTPLGFFIVVLILRGLLPNKIRSVLGS
jgi:hypothetical protein